MFENYSQYFNKAIQLKSNTELLLQQYEQAKLDKDKLSNDLKDYGKLVRSTGNNVNTMIMKWKDR